MKEFIYQLKIIKKLQEQNALLTLTLNRQMQTVDKAVKYEKEFKPSKKQLKNLFIGFV